MIFQLVLRGLLRGKARFVCAVAGIAISTGTVVFTSSLVDTNRAQAPALAKRACEPWAAWKLDGRPARRTGKSPAGSDLTMELLQLTIDYRPGGHVLQGPPMRAIMARASEQCPYACTRLVEGRWVDDRAKGCEIVCTKNTMRRFGRGEVPAPGAEVKFLGAKGTMTARIVGYLAEAKLPLGWPDVFANGAAFAALGEEERGTIEFWKHVPKPDDGVGTVPPKPMGTVPPKPEKEEARGPGAGPRGRGMGRGRLPQGKMLTAESVEVVAAFKGDEQRRMDYATPLMLVAAVMTALSLLVNSLLLSVEANRSTLAMLRMVGLTRIGVVGFVLLESVLAGVCGWGLGVGGALMALWGYVGMDVSTFPMGMSVDVGMLAVTMVLLPVVTLLAVVFALRPALSVRPMDAESQRPRPRRRGMAVTFACGFAAFVAVEVWGASLMRGFVPSPEWPDAIVSILPGGVSSFDVEKLRKLEGVKRISELVPRQVLFAGDEAEVATEVEKGGRPGGMRGGRNALFLGAEWLPKFKFLEGTWEEAWRAVSTSDAVVITEMMSRARGLHRGDRLAVRLRAGRGPMQTVEFPIAGVVDLNWHMVTSRGLVRGLNGMPGMTDGPVFASLDTLGIVDPRTYIVEPAMSANMTHLWVEYQPEFLERHGVFAAGRQIEREIEVALGSPTGSTIRLHARDEIADGTLAHGSDVIGQAARVPFVFLFVLAIGFVAMLVAESDARRREFAILRAVGATRAQLVGRLAGSALRTALLGIVCGVPAGALIGWLFAGNTGNWPGMPHYFVLPAQVVAEGAVGAVLFALVFAIPTSMALVRRRG